MSASKTTNTETPDVDCNQYLEDLRSEKSLAWVAEQNERTIRELFPSSSPIENEPLHAELLEVFDDKNRVPTVSVRGGFLVQLLARRGPRERDLEEDHVGRVQKERSRMGDGVGYRCVGGKRRKSWVYKGARFLCYGPGEYRRADRCLISLSEGGTDACEVRV